MKKPIPFGKYYLLERINVGGMAEVFKAKAFGVEGFERLLAVKRILPNIAEDEEFITMFIDEAKIAVQLQHANIAQIFDLGKVDDSYFIALEFVHGRDLRAMFDRYRQRTEVMPISMACYVIMQVCEGLDYAHNKRDAQGHELNLVHRDISPQNVLIGYEGEVKLIDFGIAKAAGKASKTQAGILKGKFGYMSPEQVRGLPIDRRSDIFSLGIVFYELLTSERLFMGESDFSTLEKVRNVEIAPPSSYNKKIPPELERIVLKVLAKDVEDRYQNSIDLHDDLQAFLYTTGELFSRKDLSANMKKLFAAEIEQDTAKLEQYRAITPPPRTRRATNAAAPRANVRVGRPDESINWDDEELETQIFDDDGEPAETLGDGDMIPVGEFDEDEATIAVGPPPEVLEQQGVTPLPREHLTPSHRGPRPISGSNPRMMGATPVPGRPGTSSGRSPYPRVTTGSSVRRTPPPQQVYPEVTPQYGPAYPAVPIPPPRKSRAGMWIVLFVILIGGFAGGAYYYQKYLNAPGKIQITAVPADAVVAIDNERIGDKSPMVVERKPGPYIVSISRDGYLPVHQNLELRAGQVLPINVALEPAAETGFILTSNPPGREVSLDGQALKGADGVPSRTNFRARIAPGKHVIEIAGDVEYQSWRKEVDLQPGFMMAIEAVLEKKPKAAVTPPQPDKPVAAAGDVKPSRGGGRSGRTGRTGGSSTPTSPGEGTPKPPDDGPKTAGGGGDECVVTLGSRPWAQVWIDGKDTGKQTPLSGYKVSCGTHKVTFKRADMKLEQTETINVQGTYKKVFILGDVFE